MQGELDITATARPVRIVGVNAAGEESGNSLMCDGRALSWLQDTPQANVWRSWGVAYRDVVVLDASNRVVEIYNLTSHDLSNSANYSELKNLLVKATQ